MTRENKLALVVGFALILFVGILISDHFSIVRTQTPADLTRMAAIDDPLGATRAQNANLIELQPIAPQPAVSAGTMQVGADHAPQPELASYVRQADNDVRPLSDVARASIPDGFVPAGSEPEPITLTAKTHEVRSGESMFAICRKHYGDTSLVNGLARFNGLDDPETLEVGQRLRIPPPEEIGGKPRPAAKPSTPATSPKPPSLKVVNEQTYAMGNGQPSSKSQPAKSAKATTYTVRAGDSLAVIANRVYGSKNKWKKLYDLNRGVIDDPDDVKVGTILKL